jgi:asparagine synthase (glutamine-hydrolysing)
MCGIYGSTINFSDDVISQKLAVINFRGPDYSQFIHTPDVVLGHNRLAIIDLDHRSNQPFSYLHLRIVFNGEIYNYRPLKARLEKEGYKFSTSSDTEVICAAYLAYGEDCVLQFNGMFAFVIYDEKKKILFGARDRLGKKPFYYCHNGQSFEFASQPSQLKIARKFTLDQQAVNEYFIWGYIPDPSSIWQEVKKLPAGHSFIYNLSSGVLNIKKYWDLDYDRENKFNGSYQDAKFILNELIHDSVGIRMNADVPLGVFLSGGIDSSLIAAIASQKVSQLKTFSIQFNEKGFDESKYAKMVAEHLGTEHHTIECNYHEGLDLISNFSNYYDEPFADPSAIPTMLLSKYTRKHVTVALSGDGGDEAFIGYTRYKRIKTMETLFSMPLIVRNLMAKLIGFSPNYILKLIAIGISIPDIESLYIKMFGGLENSWILDSEKGMNYKYTDIFKNPHKSILEKVSDYDIKTYLNGDINTKVDRASMAFSLEARAPLMDYRIIEFSRSLNTNFKFSMGNQKRILKDVLYQYLPPAMFNRPKSGFTMPFRDWFKSELKEYVLDNLSYSELQKIPGINVPRTQEIIQEHMSGKWNRYPQIWKLLVLSQWLKKQNEGIPMPKSPLIPSI